MAGRDPTRPQLDDPALIAELITALRLMGQVGLLNFSDEVIPAYLIGSRGINFGGDLPAFTSAAVFSGAVDLPLANTIVADTGPLPAGTYDVMAQINLLGSTAVASANCPFQHRNAANNATLATLNFFYINTTDRTVFVFIPLFGYVLGLNERLRISSPGLNMASGGIGANIFAQIRPTP